ncbi:MAG: T9SS type A sorting domain-containing protein, partial [Bacteroidetes bacterium]|nr:T9SS type A sorting domain-containing protein [Bacteroidota bacterium]
YIIGRAKFIDEIHFDSGHNRNGYYNFYARFDENGDFLWANTVDFPGWGGVSTKTNTYRTNNSLFSGQQGNLFIGATGIFDAKNYTYLEKINGNGESQYFHKFPSSTHPSAFCVSNDGSSYFTYYGNGITLNNINFPAQDMQKSSWLVKMNNSGAVEWVKEVKGEPRIEYRDIKADSEGNFYVTGFFADKANFGSITLNGTFDTGLEGFIVKYDKNGEVLWAKKQEALKQYEGHVIPEVICLDEERGALYQAGNLRMECSFDDIVVNNDAYKTMFLAKLYLNQPTSIDEVKKETGYLLNLYPSPARNQLNIHYQSKELNNDINFHIYNSTGTLVYSSTLIGKENITQAIDIGSFSSGVYFVNLIDGRERVARKFVVSR